MSADTNLWTYISDAGLVVKFVMILLMLASVGIMDNHRATSFIYEAGSKKLKRV